jgi:hypothetical protein
MEVEMNKIHVTAVALILGVAGALGIAAATNTAGLRTSSAKAGVSDATIAARSHRLDKVERQIARALRDKPPALPSVPAAHARSQARAQQVVYQRPAPIVVVKHSGHREDEHENEHEHEGGDD